MYYQLNKSEEIRRKYNLECPLSLATRILRIRWPSRRVVSRRSFATASPSSSSKVSLTPSSEMTAASLPSPSRSASRRCFSLWRMMMTIWRSLRQRFWCYREARTCNRDPLILSSVGDYHPKVIISRLAPLPRAPCIVCVLLNIVNDILTYKISWMPRGRESAKPWIALLYSK